jgi:hypothetical protein
MRFFAVALACLCFLAHPGCGDTPVPEASLWPAGWPSEAERTLREGHAPTPYSSAQMKASYVSGLRATYRLEQPMGPPQEVLFSFERADDRGLDMVITEFSPEGKVASEPRSLRLAWEELRNLFSVPADSCVFRRERVTVPAGTFDCIVYTTTTKEGEQEIVDTLWFPLEKPGPFVKRVTNLGPQDQKELTLLSLEVLTK